MASFIARAAGLGTNPPVANAKTAQTATNAASADTATNAINAVNATNATHAASADTATTVPNGLDHHRQAQPTGIHRRANARLDRERRDLAEE